MSGGVRSAVSRRGRRLTPAWAARGLCLASLSVVAAGCSTIRADDHDTEEERASIVVTTPALRDVRTSQGYVCQVHSRRHIEVRALDGGYLQEILVQEGQAVEEGQLLFRLLPVVYKARLDASSAELNLADIRLRNTKQLFERHVVSDQELALATAERERARAEADLARAEFRFTKIVAPFHGIVDRQYVQQGSLVEEGDMLTTLSDNELMWVYFNVPEVDYLRYKSLPHVNDAESPQRLELTGATIRLRLANGEIFGHDAGDTVTVESNFDSATGNIQFRADFPNPDHLLRHGQTGTLLIDETLEDALVIPQRATFEILDKTYVFVVGDDGVARQRVVTIAHELEDVFVVGEGLSVDDRIVLEGVRHVHDGERVEFEVRPAEEALEHLKYHAE